MKYKFGYYDDEGEFIEVDPFSRVKKWLGQPLRMLFTFLDKFNYPIICKIVKHHKTESISLFLPVKTKCHRCGLELEFKLLIPDDLIEGSGTYSMWKEYCRIANIPDLPT